MDSARRGVQSLSNNAPIVRNNPHHHGVRRQCSKMPHIGCACLLPRGAGFAPDSVRVSWIGSHIAALLCLTATSIACFGVDEPERIVQGVITRDDGMPLGDAAVSMGPDVWALTDADGTFELRGTIEELVGPITATAPGFTAWSLDTNSLGQFTARLSPRDTMTTFVAPGSITITLSFSTPTTEERFILASLDNGQVTTFLLPPNFQSSSLTLTGVTPGIRRLTLLAPSNSTPTGASVSSGAAWAEPIEIEVASDATTTIAAQLIPVEPASLDLNLPSRWSDAVTTATLTCVRSSDNQTQLLGRITGVGPSSVDVFPILDDFTGCDLIASASFQEDLGVVEHVAFGSLSPDALFITPMLVNLDYPTYHPLLPSLDTNPRQLTWPQVDDATVYDIYIARDDGGNQVSDPIWSCTTENPDFTLPELPEVALERMQLDPNQQHLVRVVARMVPNLDIEDNWDWSTYYGYVSSPWLPLPEETIAHWLR